MLAQSDTHRNYVTLPCLRHIHAIVDEPKTHASQQRTNVAVQNVQETAA